MSCLWPKNNIPEVFLTIKAKNMNHESPPTIQELICKTSLKICNHDF